MFRIFWMLLLGSDTRYACSSFLFPHSWQFCHCVSQSLNIVMYGILWLVSSPTTTLCFSLLILSFSSVNAWQMFTHQPLGIATYITGHPPVEMLPAQLMMTSLPQQREYWQFGQLQC